MYPAEGKQGHGSDNGKEDEKAPSLAANGEESYFNSVVIKANTGDGTGKLTMANGDVYEGQWVNNKRQGRGTYTYSEQQKQEDDQNGTQPLHALTLTRYEGEFYNGKKHGVGRQYYVGLEGDPQEWENEEKSLYYGEFVEN